VPDNNCADRKMKQGTSLHRLAACAAILLSIISPAFGKSKCNTNPVASLEMHTGRSGIVFVSSQIGEKLVNLLIDTGGSRSMLKKSTIDTLSLPAQAVVGKRTFVIGGTFIESYVTAHDIKLGDIKTAQMDFLVIPDSRVPPGIDGTLAPDMLRAYDAEFDFAGDKFNLYLQNSCMPVEWTTTPHVEIPFKLDGDGHITLTVQLDGKDVSTSLDTGSSLSILRLESAEATFGFDDRSPLLTRAGQTALARVYKYPFRLLQFGDVGVGTVAIPNPELALMSRADTGMIYGPDLILGMGVLRNLHMYINYKQQKIYATRAWLVSPEMSSGDER